VPGRAAPRNQGISPVLNCLCAQDDLEPVLRRFAEAQTAGALRFNTELTEFRQDADGVDVVITDRVTGNETPVRAQYVIAADGNQSRIRRGPACGWRASKRSTTASTFCSTPICGRGPNSGRRRSILSSSPIYAPPS
jgi:2-polyprenyl-6-methoxyphenol hydroxylase-like FAD-dependent oxidoreductase